jgi:hypothetical protein
MVMTPEVWCLRGWTRAGVRPLRGVGDAIRVLASYAAALGGRPELIAGAGGTCARCEAVRSARPPAARFS